MVFHGFGFEFFSEPAGDSVSDSGGVADDSGVGVAVDDGFDPFDLFFPAGALEAVGFEDGGAGLVAAQNDEGGVVVVPRPVDGDDVGSGDVGFGFEVHAPLYCIAGEDVAVVLDELGFVFGLVGTCTEELLLFLEELGDDHGVVGAWALEAEELVFVVIRLDAFGELFVEVVGSFGGADEGELAVGGCHHGTEDFVDDFAGDERGFVDGDVVGFVSP